MATTSLEAPASVRAECAFCMQETSESSLITTCDEHDLCLACLREVFERAIKHEYHNPPNCCGPAYPLEINDYTNVLDQDFIIRFLEKQREYRTPHHQRTYCSATNCNKFLDKASHNDSDSSATCTSCNARTCTSCKTTVNDPQTHTCQPSEEDQKAILYSHSQGWKQCPSCHGLVELREACNHITCEHCNYEFCFVCLTAFPCQYGCPNYGKRTVFEDGYDEQGFHFATGFDREGYDRDGFDKRGNDAQGRSRPPGWNAMKARDRHRNVEEHGGLELTREEHELARNMQRIFDLERGIIHDGELSRFARAQQAGRDSDDEEDEEGEDSDDDDDDEEDGGPEDEEDEEDTGLDDEEDDGADDEGEAMDWVPDLPDAAQNQ